MTRLHIKIKDDDKVAIVLNLLKELPFVEIEQSGAREIGKSARKEKKGFADLFGLWEGREVSLSDIRKKAWARN